MVHPACPARATFPARATPAARRLALLAAVLALSGCNGIYLGDNPGPDVAKQTGPLTVPPAHVREGRE